MARAIYLNGLDNRLICKENFRFGCKKNLVACVLHLLYI